MKKCVVLPALVTVALLTSCLSLGPVDVFAGTESSIAQAVVGQTAQSAPAQPKLLTRVEADKRITIAMFFIFILITLGIVYWAAKKTTTSSDYYTASGTITGTQNGWAMAGDFMSAASFLGVTGLISLFGWDGIMYSIGATFAYITILLIVAEPCRNIGKYTVGDILSFRASPVPVRATMAFAAVLLSIMYLVVQMVGGGKLMELLLGIPYTWAVFLFGVLMIIYVVFGGMIATTWVQIIKAALLLGGAIILFLLMAANFGFNPLRLFSAVVSSQSIQSWVQVSLLKQPVATEGFEYGRRFLEPALLQKSVWDQVSLGMAFLLGTAGMPHILMRFFTVPDAKAARKSVVITMTIIGVFFVDGNHARSWRRSHCHATDYSRSRQRREYGKSAYGPGSRRRCFSGSGRHLVGLFMRRCFCHNTCSGIRTCPRIRWGYRPRHLGEHCQTGKSDPARTGDGCQDHVIRRRHRRDIGRRAIRDCKCGSPGNAGVCDRLFRCRPSCGAFTVSGGE